MLSKILARINPFYWENKKMREELAARDEILVLRKKLTASNILRMRHAQTITIMNIAIKRLIEGRQLDDSAKRILSDPKITSWTITRKRIDEYNKQIQPRRRK